jgi:hypothetical protein
MPPSAAGLFLLLHANSFCREAEMTDNNKKKCWREKVTAEITLAHVQQFVQETGSDMTLAEVVQFLNENGRAQDVWIHMMQAAEQYIKSNVKPQNVRMAVVEPRPVQVAMVQ